MQTSDAISEVQTGFGSGAPTATGSFTYQFNQAGIYYYSSGFVESTNQIMFRGIIEVVNSQDKELEIDVQLNGVDASKCVFPFVYNGVNYTDCTNIDAAFSMCSTEHVYSGLKLRCDPLGKINMNLTKTKHLFS